MPAAGLPAEFPTVKNAITMSLFRLLYRSDSELTGSDRAVRDDAFAIADTAAARNATEASPGR